MDAAQTCMTTTHTHTSLAYTPPHTRAQRERQTKTHAFRPGSSTAKSSTSGIFHFLKSCELPPAHARQSMLLEESVLRGCVCGRRDEHVHVMCKSSSMDG